MTESQSTDRGTVAVLLTEYEQSGREWDLSAHDARAANPLFDRNHDLYKKLRTSTEGRRGIAALLADPNPGLRLLAATHSLAWQELDAVAALRALEHAGGLHAVTAKYTLRAHRSGSLHLDW